MQAFRDIWKDRISATAIAVLFAVFLLVQGFVSGWANAAMAAPSAFDPLHEICSSADSAQTDKESPVPKVPDCPCGSLCRLAAAPPNAIIPVSELSLRVSFSTVATTYVAVPDVPNFGARRLRPEVRGPPRYA